MRGAALVWGLGLAAYTTAVFDRASLGVASLQAQHRFGVGAAVLGLFAVLQLAVYAALQIPVGVLVDRLGSRRLLVAGALLMGAGQLALGLAHSAPAAIGARVLVGAGDAMTFISVLRLVPVWFPARRVPLVTQLTGILGQLGQVAAAYPLVALLGAVGWTPAFAGAGALSVLVALLVGVALREAPPGAPAAAPAAGLDQVRRQLRAAWEEPGTRIGLWTHFTTQFSGTVFGLLWGYPFLVVGEGLAPATAGLLLGLLVLVGMVVGPLLGALVGGWPLRRSALTFAIVGATALVWTAVLAWPGRAPLPLLVLLVVVLASNGPGSMVGFDYARTFNPARRLGSATGIVNVGGFVASLTVILTVGLVLDATRAAGARGDSLGSFKAAFAVQYVLWAVGTLGVLRHRRVLRARLAERDGILLDALPRAAVRRWRERSVLSAAGAARR